MTGRVRGDPWEVAPIREGVDAFEALYLDFSGGRLTGQAQWCFAAGELKEKAEKLRDGDSIAVTGKVSIKKKKYGTFTSFWADSLEVLKRADPKPRVDGPHEDAAPEFDAED